MIRGKSQGQAGSDIKKEVELSLPSDDSSLDRKYCIKVTLRNSVINDRASAGRGREFFGKPNVMKIQVKADGEGYYTISCQGEPEWPGRIDLTAAVKEAVAGKELRGLVIDLEGVSFIDSAGLGQIFSLRRYASESGAHLVVSRPTLGIARLLNVVNLPALIPVTDTLEDARHKMAVPKSVGNC